MKKLKVEEAVGHTLCHDMTAILPDGSKGPLFRRGHVIEAGDVERMKDIGKFHVFVWEPEANEVHEDDAARAVTELLCDDSLNYKGPSEGKFQIRAAVDGLFCVNEAGIRALNRVEDYTVACLPNHYRVQAGQQVSGARIVPLVTRRANVEAAVRVARDHFPIFSVKPFRPLKCGVIITGSEVYYGRIKDRFEPVMRAKIDHYHGECLGVTKCPDELEKIEVAITDYLSRGAELIFLTGGMSVDPDDLTPTAIRRSGARLVTQGAPMQPGNMLTIAYLEGCALVGVPGASMHFPATSLDVFLPRLFAQVEITRDDITDMGLGGFCLNCEKCHFPVCHFGRH